MRIEDLFEVSDGDTIGDAWLTTINLLEMLEHSQKIGEKYYFDEARNKIAKIYMAAESHSIDEGELCRCGLSNAEHALLKRKILTFFKLQVSNLKHFLY